MATNFPKPVKPTDVSKVKTDWHLPKQPKVKKPKQPKKNPVDSHNYINSHISGNRNSAHYSTQAASTKSISAPRTDHATTKKPRTKYGKSY